MSKRAVVVTTSRGFWPFSRGQILYEPFAIAIVASVAFGVGIMMGEPWATVPLAATIVTAAVTPASEEATFSSSIIGNLMAIMVAFVTIDALGLAHHSVSAVLAAYSPMRALGVLAAVILTPFLCSLLNVIQPAAAATAAFIVFGGIVPTAHAALVLAVNIIIVSTLGEFIRRLRLKGALR